MQKKLRSGVFIPTGAAAAAAAATATATAAVVVVAAAAAHAVAVAAAAAVAVIIRKTISAVFLFLLPPQGPRGVRALGLGMLRLGVRLHRTKNEVFLREARKSRAPTHPYLGVTARKQQHKKRQGRFLPLGPQLIS